MSLQENQVRITDSPVNGKARVIEWIGITTRWDLKTIMILTKRKFFDKDSENNLTDELTGVDYLPYEHNLIASNEKLCNPSNGYMVYESGYTSGNTVYIDAANNIVVSPIGLFDFFRPFLSEPVSQNDLIKSNVLIESSVYGTWDK